MVKTLWSSSYHGAGTWDKHYGHNRRPWSTILQEPASRSSFKIRNYSYLPLPTSLHLLTIPQSPNIVTLPREQVFKMCACGEYLKFKP